MVTILYLAHDLDDSAIWRRVSMLEAGGASVTVAGFRRGSAPLHRPAILLGMTANGRMLQRLGAVAKAVRQAGSTLGKLPKPDVILARNLEMLGVARRALGLWGKDRPSLAYEVLDIHRMMLGDGLPARALRAAERALSAKASLLLTSSPGFLRAYFAAYGQIGPGTTPRLVENKVNDFDLVGAESPAARPTGNVPVIGWFGILRCAKSLEVLDQATRAAPGTFRVLLAGRPALDVLPQFHQTVAANPDLDFVGAYRNPEDLPRLYGAVDLAWMVDRYDAGANSDWLLPNRLYEGCLHGAIPLALRGTEVASFLGVKGIGVALTELTPAAIQSVMDMLTDERRAQLTAVLAQQPRTNWVATRQEAQDLVTALGQARRAKAEPVATTLREAS